MGAAGYCGQRIHVRDRGGRVLCNGVLWACIHGVGIWASNDWTMGQY
jgi:hypothetical protein